MRTAKCNVCGLEWDLVNEKGVQQISRLRLKGYYWQAEKRPRWTKADLCSLECVIVWARIKQKEIANECSQ